MAISRMQEPRQLYGLGSLVKGVKKAVKGVAKGAKNILKSDAGKLLGIAALGSYGLGMGPLGGLRGAGFLSNIPAMFSNAVEGYKNLEGPQKFLAQAGIGTAIGGGLAALMDEEEETREIATQDVQSLRKYLSSYYSNLGYTADQIAENVERDTSEYGYADGGRIGFNSGTPKGFIMTLMDGTRVQIPAGAYKDGKFKDIIYSTNKGDLLREEIVRKLEFNEGGRVNYAMGTGDKVEMAAGIEGLPINVNPKGVKELDLRETGGFIAPVGVKEKADDIPAMLSNNEFVFTADAVRAAGGGSVDKGAQIMYDTMKKLESKVV